jgi:hypothetical protein
LLENVNEKKKRNALKARYNVAFLKEIICPLEKGIQKVTTNISPGYNGAQNPLFV